MKVLITGATGFIGSSIVRELLKDGVEVKVIVREKSNTKNIGKYLYYDCSKAVKEPGMPQTPIRTTIEKAVRWFRENGYINVNSN